VFEALHNLIIPDTWQVRAIGALKSGKDLVLSAPTGAGKTFVFEQWFQDTRPSSQALYTVPTRALANDKYFEWKAKGWRVGILTGDVSHAADAPVVVATLEAARGKIATGSPSLLAVDEYQWISDPARGHHFEAAIVSAPAQTRLLLLSGCVANPEAVAAWLTRLGRSVEVVEHRERPVPLEEMDFSSLASRAPSSLEGYWTRGIYGALREDLGPVLIFAPQRQDAEKMARTLAKNLPPCAPLELSPEQRQLAGAELGKMLATRVAWHHSGMDYLQRAGLVEPLAKSGQLRVVVATLGLAAGINFSLRSVLVTSGQYKVEGEARPILCHELLQMAGRAGRRGLDEMGYYLVADQSPRLDEARSTALKRASTMPVGLFLQACATPDPATCCARAAASLFSKRPLLAGHEQTTPLVGTLPCGQGTDTGRARLVRRKSRRFSGCKGCQHRAQCQALSLQPTVLWQLQRAGLIAKDLTVTERGRIAACFPGPDGMALAAAVEVKGYLPEEIVFDLANLYAGERFCGEEPRWSGRLAAVCQQVYGSLEIEGCLVSGVPPHYGTGGSEAVRGLHENSERKSRLTSGFAMVGDLVRLHTEWRSLMRQILAAEVDSVKFESLREIVRSVVAPALAKSYPPEIPALLPAQKNPIQHRFTRVQK